jgi:integrase
VASCWPAVSNVDLDAATLRVDRSWRRPRPVSASSRQRPPMADEPFRYRQTRSQHCASTVGSSWKPGWPSASGGLSPMPWCSASPTARRRALLAQLRGGTPASASSCRASFHSLRHAHASALIAGGVEIVSISRRLCHSSPVVTLRIYAHLFSTDDSTAADAIEAAMRTGAQR